MLGYLRGKISSILQLRAIKRHGSRVGWRIAPRYTNYLHECRKTFFGEMPVASKDVVDAVENFQRDGIASFHTLENENVANLIYKKILQRQQDGEEMWGPLGTSGNRNYTGCVYKDFPELEHLFRGDVGRFLYLYYGAHFKIFYATMFKSVNIGEAPQGSQLWHSDSGPGTCVVVAFYLHDVLDEGAGVLHALPWKHSVDVFKKEYDAVAFWADSVGVNLRAASGEARRELIVKYYAKAIEDKYSKFVIGPKGPAGLIVPFLNNVIHFGGYPEAGRERLAVLFHCYPSDKPPDFARYRSEGLRKTKPYPLNPSE